MRTDKYHGGVPTDRRPPILPGHRAPDPETPRWLNPLLWLPFRLIDTVLWVIRPNWWLNRRTLYLQRRFIGQEMHRPKMHNAANAAMAALALGVGATMMGEWDLGGGSGGGAIVTPNQLYVSTGSNASDSNAGQLSAPFATIAKAIATAGSTPTQINAGVGTFTITAPDANGNGITLANVGDLLQGAGQGLTTINLTTGAFTWGIKSQAGTCAVRDLLVKFSSGTCTYGVGVSVAPAGSAEQNEFRSVYVQDASSSGLTAGFALGPDHSGSATLDVSGTEFWDCTVLGNSTNTGTGWLVGNGTTGNVVNNEAFGCHSYLCLNNVKLGGSGFRWFGGGWSTTRGADITTFGTRGLDPVLFVGVRGDTGNLVYDDSGSSDNNAQGGVQFEDCQFTGYTPTLHSTNIINFTSSGTCKLIGGVFTTSGANTTFYVVGGSAAAPATFVAIGVFTDNLTAWANPVPTNTKRFWWGNTYPVAGAWVPNPNAYNVVDASPSPGANVVTVTANAGTVPVGAALNNFTNSSAATMAITMAVTGAVDGQVTVVRIYDFSGAAETIGWTNTENSGASVPTTSNGSTTLPKTVTFMYNGKTSKWRCIQSV